MTSKKQILVCGSINGQFTELFDKIKKVNKKSGPFSAAYCVGDFFVKGCEAQWDKVKLAGCVIPLYIFGPHSSEVNISNFTSKSDGELAPNVVHLGNRGILKSNGLKIAYLSGVDGETNQSDSHVQFTPDDVQFIRDSCVKNADFKGVDLLLTYEWPSEVVNHETRENVPKGDLPPGSDKISWLSLHIRPQYIFSGKENIFYARRPYRNYFGGTKEHVSRFVSLSGITGTKWISAYNITPLDDIDHGQIIPNMFDCPFNRQLLEFDLVPSLKESKAQQFFYDTNPQRGQKRKKNFDEKKKRGPAFDVNDCWFCLSSTNVEKHLVVTIGEEMYVVLAKGCLTEGHLIILPVGHHHSSLDLPPSAEIELEKFKKSLRAYFKSINKIPIFFERSFKNFHCQIHVIPIPDDVQGVKPVFQDAGEAEGLEFLDLPPGVPLKDVLKKKLIETPSGNREVNPPFFFLEMQVLASEDILNLPDRDSWKSCVVSKEEETAQTVKFRNAFKPFNFVKDDDDDSD
ncbi:hypothetical protein M8J76_017198 [Diaphorina citri]|nr:hypothetical protein M8J76_017198 [Diaphorina citri]